MRVLLSSFILGCSLLGVVQYAGQSKVAPPRIGQADPDNSQIIEAFGRQGFRINGAEAVGIRANVLLALGEARSHGLGNSKVDFAAVEIARDLGLPTSHGSNTVHRVVAALGNLMGQVAPPHPDLSWDAYFTETMNLWHQPSFMGLMARHQFHPVKISWEDIGRHEGSVWGDRISDVGIWVRKHEQDPDTARLALSVRRDGNFRDKVLMVPSERIKVHVKEGGRTVEKTLPQRLAELGLASQHRDRHVIVSNQFAIVPVPGRSMSGGAPPRAAFNFSIFPYGSTNFVITDVIEGSSEAIVGPGTHQMLYANLNGQKAPFTASRAEDRPDLLRLERDLKAKGMDVDVQRYYLIQIPLRRDRNIGLSNLGTPPLNHPQEYSLSFSCEAPAPIASSKTKMSVPMEMAQERAGLGRVAIGHGEAEGSYFVGADYQGARAEEPIRVTVVYFVTPIGHITEADMQTFTRAFTQWDDQAVWGGSFVTKE